MQSFLVTLVGHDELKKIGQDASGQKVLVQFPPAELIDWKEELNEMLRPVHHAIRTIKPATKKDLKIYADHIKTDLDSTLEAIKAAHEIFNETEAYVITGLIMNADGLNHQSGFLFAHEDPSITMTRHAHHIAKLRGYDKDAFEIDMNEDCLNAYAGEEPVFSFVAAAVPPMHVTFKMARESFFGAMNDGIERSANSQTSVH
jgi:hypothetical protein